MTSMFNAESLVIITGTNRGLGREILTQFASKMRKPSLFFMISQSAETLKLHCKEMSEKFNQHNFVSYPCDLSDPTDTLKLCDMLRKDLSEKLTSQTNVIMVHNAASSGQIDRTSAELDDASKLQSYTFLNFSSVILLNAALQQFLASSSLKPKCWVVNISSLAAKKPDKCLTEYCSMKAARDVATTILALENQSIKCLTYSPGPLQTDMLNSLRATWCNKDLVDTWPVLTCEQSVAKLMTILEMEGFESGAVIDYFDE